MEHYNDFVKCFIPNMHDMILRTIISMQESCLRDVHESILDT